MLLTLNLASILITAMLVDMIISSFFDIIGGKLASTLGLVLFIVLLVVIFGMGQYLLLGFVQQVSKDLRKRKRDINLTYRLVTIT
jgi:hypothetical protein